MTQISWWKTDLIRGEAEAAAKAVHDRLISQGPLTRELEAAISQRLGVRHAIAVPSGSQGLLLTMLALDIKPGDEVIVPDITWIATAHGAALLGARIVLVDSCADAPLLDPDRLEDAITPRTRAIIAVHLAGRAVDMDGVQAVAKRHAIPVIEDAAQALGSQSSGRHLGTIGDMGVYSLGLAKLVSSGQGGIVVTDDDVLHDKMRLCAQHGTASLPAERYMFLGMNMKYPDILASVALRQFDRINNKIAHVCKIYETYRDGLGDVPGLEVLTCDVDDGAVPLWTEVRVADRARVIAHFEDRGIGSRPMHVPLHTAAHLNPDVGYTDTEFPNATRLAGELLVLPSGPDQPLENVARVIDVLRNMERSP